MATKEFMIDYRFIVPAGLACTFVLLLVAEWFFPLRRRRRRFARRFVVNVCMTAMAFAVGSVSVRSVALALAGWASEHSVGLSLIVPVPGVVRVVLGFVLMDLAFYYWHWLNHRVPVMWRFHNVHHLDPDMDVSTSFRFHFVEVLYSTAFRAVQVCLVGVVPVTYIAYEVVFQCATMFHHSNLRLPIRLERWLNMVFVTPRMHGIHHSVVRDETNSNYSVIFRWWDRLHGTLRLNVPQSAIDIGVAAYREQADNRLTDLFLLPFRAQRDYWLFSDGTVPRSGRVGESRTGELLE
ncbi:MAG: sterol desaturase family protein [Phycisphaerales bacterium]|nr:MAG: sterol desaturase family protein [Phycisphaerales bacterium]